MPLSCRLVYKCYVLLSQPHLWHKLGWYPISLPNTIGTLNIVFLEALSSPKPAVCVRVWPNRQLIVTMGFISGDWAGQASTWMPLPSNHCFAFLKLCLRSLSCWNILFTSSISNLLNFFSSPSSKMSQYCYASMVF